MTYAESVADRKIPVRKRGSLTGRMVDPFTRRKVVYESGLELWWLTVLIASPAVHSVEEQQLVEVPMKGRTTRHYFDCRINWMSGRRTAVAVKYAKDVDDDLRALLSAAASTVGDAFANDYRIFSERGLSRTMIHNARKVISCGLDHDFEAQAAVATALTKAGDRIRLGDCDALLGEGNRGSRAAMALIKFGKLVHPTNERLGPGTVLRNLFTN